MSCIDPSCPICHPKGTGWSPYDTELYYAQLRLVGKGEGNGNPVANVPYRLLLGDGTYERGTTDAQGLTAVICTQQPVALWRLMLPVPASAPLCCDAPDRGYEKMGFEVPSGNAPFAFTAKTTTTPAITTVEVPKGGERSLTRGEEAMARTVFGDSIDYRKVKIRHGSYWLLGRFQREDTAVTPDGNIHAPHPIYRDDYSAGTGADRRLFMHEMVHVWQFQRDYAVKLNGLRVSSRGRIAYQYQLSPESRLADYNMEQQGDIMADYYMICIERNPQDAFNPRMSADLLYHVMQPFVNPIKPLHLPTK
ncbi:hypothetical protein [Dyella japonica]|uniref:hypothetical protein n=1 Tax=Dyella japonica TaxID=231455 RepID=UPI000A4F56C4|nr:hypothetical protein [Dyella japonica]